jgi:transposase-like protein
MKCKECESEELIKAGTQVMRKTGLMQRIKCKKCGYIFLVPMDEAHE